MSVHTPIEWADSACNPSEGCDGCELWVEDDRACYSGAKISRLAGTHPGFPMHFERVVLYPGRMFDAARWKDLSGTARRDKPWLDGKPRHIFISDMGDSLSAAVSFEFLKTEIIDHVSSPAGLHHVWIWLTKRPARMAALSSWLQAEGHPWPPNLWVGTSITTSNTVGRIAHLLEVGDERTVRVLSLEPQRGDLGTLPHLSRIDWIIQGGESRQLVAKRFGLASRFTAAAPFRLEWARAVREQCRRTGTAYFLKQLGSAPLVGSIPLSLKDPHGRDWDEWPRDLRVREFPPRSDKEDRRREPTSRCDDAILD